MSPPRRRRGKSSTPSRIRRLGSGGSSKGSGPAASGGASSKSQQQFWHGKEVGGKDVVEVCEAISAGILDRLADSSSSSVSAGPMSGGAAGSASIYGDDLSAATATVRSLGPPPLAGRETIAEHYFEAAYQRATIMAEALLEQA